MFLVCATSSGGGHDSPEKPKIGHFRPFGRRGFLSFRGVIRPVLGCVLSGEFSVHHRYHGLSGLLGWYTGNLPLLRVRGNRP
jgi:hypothetical protein